MKSPKKHKKCENVTLDRLEKGHTFTVQDLKPEGRVSPCSILVGNTYVGQFKLFATLCMYVNYSVWMTDFRVTTKYYWVGEFEKDVLKNKAL